MADFDSNGVLVDTVWTLVYETPAGVTGVVLLAQAASIDDVDVVTLDVAWGTDVGSGGDAVHLVANLDVNPGEAVRVADGRLALPAGNKIWAKASQVDGIEMTVSVLEEP